MKIAGLLTAAFFAVLLFDSSTFAEDVLLQIEIQPALNYGSDHSTLDLIFPDFTNGAVTNTISVNYSLMANDVGRTQGVISGHLEQLLPGIDFQANVGSYSKLSGNASLVPAASGFVVVTTEETGFADKVVDEGDGKLVDGTLMITYRAVITGDQPAGQQTGMFTVSFVDN